MQDNPAPISLPTILSGLAALASLIGIPLSAFLTWLFTRPKQSADIHKTKAETGKTEAEQRQIDSAILMRAYERLDDYEAITLRQGREITTLSQQVLTIEFESKNKDRKIATQAADIELLDLQVQRARAQGFLEDREPGAPNPAAQPS